MISYPRQNLGKWYCKLKMNNFCGQGCSSYVTEKSSLEEAVLCLEESSCSSSCTISDPLCPRRWVGCVREEHGRCGADVAVLLCTGKAPLLCSSSPLKPGMKCLQSCWRCKCWVAPMLGIRSFIDILLELCWYGQSCLRFLLLHALCFASPHTIWRSYYLVGFPRDAISLKVHVNLLSGSLYF